MVRFTLNKHPQLKRIAVHCRFTIWRWKLAIKSRLKSNYADPFKKYWVDPRKIEYCVIRKYNKWAEMGEIVGGNWDKRRIKFECLDVFKAFQDRFLYGKSWKNTEFYHRVLKEINEGKVKWRCRSKANLDVRFKQLDFLFYEIKNNGYKPQHLVVSNNDPMYFYDEVSVCIDRDGVLLFEDGRHRLAIAKLLRIKKIPVQITIRHSKWYEFKQQILDYAKKNGGKIYHPLTHPDLGDIPSIHGEKRFEKIKQSLPLKEGEILDIGAHWGYFCHKFEEEGFKCYAVENDPNHIYFLKKLKKAENRNFEIIEKSIFEYREKTKFDVVLALNIFHHFLKEKKSYFQLIELLRRLDMNIMFFEPHIFKEPQMRGAYINYTPEEFVKFILKNSCLNKAELIGEAENGRPIYKLSR